MRMEVCSGKRTMTVTDPVHGSIPISDIQRELMQTVELQRLNAVHQLGMTYQVYPSAHSMRFPHALGVSHLAQKMGQCLILQNEQLSLTENRRNELVTLLTAAGLLHDICHTPWSHTLEPLLMELVQKNHMEMTRELLQGNRKMPIPGSGRIPEILHDFGIDPADVADLITQSFKGPAYVQQMIFGEVDADTMDYLCRDFYSTGVSFGHLDINRLIQTMIVLPNRLCFQIKGLPAVRDFLNARIEMYSAVYLHKTTRIADMMFLKAARVSIIENGEFSNFWSMTDDELLSAMMNYSHVEFTRDIAWRLKYRQDLFKRVYHMDSRFPEPHRKRFMDSVSQLGDSLHQITQRLESMIESEVAIPKGYVIVDLIGCVAECSEPRFNELDIGFVDKDGTVLRMEDIDRSFVEYLQHSQPSRSFFSIYTPERYREDISRTITGIIQRLIQ